MGYRFYSYTDCKAAMTDTPAHYCLVSVIFISISHVPHLPSPLELLLLELLLLELLLQCLTCLFWLASVARRMAQVNS